jgi:HEAT repeat protein
MKLFGGTDVDDLIAHRDIAGLLECLEKEDTISQLKAAIALAELHQSEGVEFLIWFLKHPKLDVRSAAVEALGSLRAEEAVPELIPLLKDRDADFRELVSTALQQIGTAEALRALEERNIEEVTPPQEYPDQGFDLANSTADPITGVNPYKQQDIPTEIGPVERRRAREFFRLADQHQEEGRPVQALDECNTALAIWPSWADAYNLKGIILEDLNKPYQAMLAYQRAVKIDPTLTAAANNLADSISELEVTQVPLTELLEAVSTGEWETRQEAIAALNQRPEPEAVEEIIHLVSDDDPDISSFALDALEASSQPAAKKALAEYYGVSLDDIAENDQEKDFFVDLHPTDLAEPFAVPPMLTAADCLEDADRCVANEEDDLAFLYVQYALALESNNADAWNQLGIVQECRGNPADAMRAYKNAVELDATFKEARANLEELENDYGQMTENYELLIIDLTSREDDLVYPALVDLGRTGMRAAVEQIREHLTSDSRRISIAAVNALAELGDVAAVADICDVFSRLADSRVEPQRLTHREMDNLRQPEIAICADRLSILIGLLKLEAFQQFAYCAKFEFKRLAALRKAFEQDESHELDAAADLFFLNMVAWMSDYLEVRDILPVLHEEKPHQEVDIAMSCVLEGWLKKQPEKFSPKDLACLAEIPDFMVDGVCIHSLANLRVLAQRA